MLSRFTRPVSKPRHKGIIHNGAIIQPDTTEFKPIRDNRFMQLKLHYYGLIDLKDDQGFGFVGRRKKGQNDSQTLGGQRNTIYVAHG